MNIRDIKLDILLGNPNEIVDEFIRITDGIQIMSVPVYREHGREFIWYVGDKWLFYQDVKNDNFWCNYEEYWSIFESKFSLNYRDIQSITKFMVETDFKNGVGTPHPDHQASGILVETDFKNGVGMPITFIRSRLQEVETAFKNGVGTPHLNRVAYPYGRNCFQKWSRYTAGRLQLIRCHGRNCFQK